MKNINVRIAASLIALALTANQAAIAANYYVDGNRASSGNGLSFSSAFRTIQEAANAATAGSNVYIGGGTYRETITPAHSGASGASITFQPYQNQHVVVTGLDVAPSSGWTLNNNRYERTYANGNIVMDGHTVNQLFIDGKPMNEARSINSGYNNPLRQTFHTVASVSQNNGVYTITPNTTLAGNWNGAKIAIRGGTTAKGADDGYYSASGVTQSGNSLSFYMPAGYPTDYAPSVGNRFYLYNAVSAVDTNKEYYYTGTKFYVDSSMNPNGKRVEVRNRVNGLSIGSGKSFINVRGIDFQAAKVKILGNNNTVDNCRVLYATPFYDSGLFSFSGGVTTVGTGNTISNSEIAYSWDGGVKDEGTSNTIHNNVIHDTGFFGSISSPIDINRSTNSTVSNNTVYNCGSSGVYHYSAPQGNITNNDISRYGYLAKDLGGTYTWGTDGDGAEIAYNFIHQGKLSSDTLAGVMLDEGSSNFNVHHNVITGVNYGVHMNGGSANQNVYNNTMEGIYSGKSVNSNGSTNCYVYNNLSKNGQFDANKDENQNPVAPFPHHNTVYTNADNEFVNTDAGNYQLKSTSGAIGKGATQGGVPNGTDTGAYQYGEPAWTAGANFKAWSAGNQLIAPLSSGLYVGRYGATEFVQSDSSLCVGKYSTGDTANRRAFMKFNLSGLPDSSGPIGKAVLRLYECTNPDSATGGVNLYQVTSAWNEGNIIYNQSVGASKSGWYDPANLDLYTDIDITEWVQGWLDHPSSNYGLSLRSTMEGVAGTAKYWDNYFAMTAPQLLITVPEPNSFLVLATGLFGLLAYAWRKRK